MCKSRQRLTKLPSPVAGEGLGACRDCPETVWGGLPAAPTRARGFAACAAEERAAFRFPTAAFRSDAERAQSARKGRWRGHPIRVTGATKVYATDLACERPLSTFFNKVWKRCTPTPSFLQNGFQRTERRRFINQTDVAQQSCRQTTKLGVSSLLSASFLNSIILSTYKESSRWPWM